jgi:hypothetical protein
MHRAPTGAPRDRLRELQPGTAALASAARRRTPALATGSLLLPVAAVRRVSGLRGVGQAVDHALKRAATLEGGALGFGAVSRRDYIEYALEFGFATEVLRDGT